MAGTSHLHSTEYLTTLKAVVSPTWEKVTEAGTEGRRAALLLHREKVLSAGDSSLPLGSHALLSDTIREISS
jgi:hypothetical protein